MELLGRAKRMQWRNRGCTVGGRRERLQALFREGNAGEPGTLIVAVGLIFEFGCAKERGRLVNQRILRLKI